MEGEEFLKKKLEILSKCKGLSKEDLAGKYRKAFEQLKHEIKNCATDLLKEISLRNFRWDEVEWDPIVDEINRFLEEPAGRAIMKDISCSLYKNCSYEEYYSGCLKMREQIKHIFWKHAPKDWERVELEVKE